MLSSMSPTILTKDGKLFMVTGSPGGRTIINTVLETIVDVIDFGMNAQEAVDAPKFHHQWLPDVVSVEQELPSAAIKPLEEMGYQVKIGGHWSDGECIMIDPKSGERLGASDKRNNGRAIGF